MQPFVVAFPHYTCEGSQVMQKWLVCKAKSPRPKVADLRFRRLNLVLTRKERFARAAVALDARGKRGHRVWDKREGKERWRTQS
jgi:hypothetical protein